MLVMNCYLNKMIHLVNSYAAKVYRNKNKKKMLTNISHNVFIHNLHTHFAILSKNSINIKHSTGAKTGNTETPQYPVNIIYKIRMFPWKARWIHAKWIHSRTGVLTLQQKMSLFQFNLITMALHIPSFCSVRCVNYTYNTHTPVSYFTEGCCLRCS